MDKTKCVNRTGDYCKVYCSQVTPAGTAKQMLRQSFRKGPLLIYKRCASITDCTQFIAKEGTMDGLKLMYQLWELNKSTNEWFPRKVRARVGIQDEILVKYQRKEPGKDFEMRPVYVEFGINQVMFTGARR